MLESAIRKALAQHPDSAADWYDLGLLYKYRGRWSESLECCRRACMLNPTDEAARWNLGIAATALGDWATARAAWSDYGIDLPAGSGPIHLELGPVPVRLPGDRPEVVWCTRIDPARAVVESVPFPESGFAKGDTVLHDGAPNGYRKLGEQEVPVYDGLALLERSLLSTFVVEVDAPSDTAVSQLEGLFEQRGMTAEDWTRSVRFLCKACSEGRPHDRHDLEELPPRHRSTSRRLGVAALSLAAVQAVVSQWGNTVESVICGLKR